MAYFTLLWKARTIEKYRLNYEREKLNSIRLTGRQNPKKTLYERWQGYNLNTKKRISNAFLRRYPKGSTMYNFFYYLRTDQTFPNFLLKTIIGFVVGIVLTYLCFMFFVFQLSISLVHATVMSSIIGVLLTLGLAFSYRIRCLVFLLIPQFFSRVGRYTLTSYALILILTGPATNTLKNSEVLSESLACGQEQIKSNMRQINESMQKPFDSVKESLRPVINSLKQLAARIKTLSVRIQRLALSIATTLQSGYYWLKSTVEICNQRLGSPHQHCRTIISEAVVDCQATFGPKLYQICDAVKMTDVFCRPFEHLPAFCHAIEFVNGNVLAVVTEKLKTFSARMKTMVYMDIKVHHTYTFSTNSSKTTSAAAGIVTEIRNRADPLLTWISWSSCVTSLSLLLIISRAKYYQHMFETRPKFDNRYVTKELRALDLKRLRQGKDFILPLNRREEQKYIKTTSFRLVPSERIHITRSAVTMAITTFKLTIHMVADYSLYWVLMLIRYHGGMQTALPPEAPDAGIIVTGSGMITKILKALIGSLSLPLTVKPPSPVTCLPNPHPPDFQRYSQIGILIFLLWFFALFEPYGLRLRHVIMGMYRPERAKARAVWLYNHIQTNRGYFMKFARRKLHREYKYTSEEKHTFRRWLNSHIPFSLLRDILGVSPDEPHCFLCGVIGSCNECDGTLTRCETPKCPGTYCNKCFSDIGMLCTICLSPRDYGDLSDVSLEKGSSDSGDSSDDDFPSFKPDVSGESTQYRVMEEGKNNSPPKDDDGKSRRLFFSKKKTKGPQDNNFSPTQKEKEVNGGLASHFENMVKVVTAKRKYFTDLDLEDDKNRKVTSLGQDTNYFLGYLFLKIDKNLATYVINSQYDKIKEKPVQECDKAEVTALKRNVTKERYFYAHRPRMKRQVKSDHSITKLLQRFRNLRKYALKRSYSSRNILHKRRLTGKKMLVPKLSSAIWPNSRKRKKKEEISPPQTKFNGNRDLILKGLINGETAGTNGKEKQNKAYRKKYQNKRRNSKQFNKLRKKVIQMLIFLRQRRCEYSNRKCSRRIKETTVSKNELIERQVIKPADNANVENNNIAETDANNHAHYKDIKVNYEEGIAKRVQSKISILVKALSCIYSDCWKNRKIRVPSIKIVNFFTRADPTNNYEKTNHKRRKKVQCFETESHVSYNNRKDNEDTRKYRISSYLSEQNWMKKPCQKEKSGGNLTVVNEASNEVGTTESEKVVPYFEEEIKDSIKDEKIKTNRDNVKTVERHEAITLKCTYISGSSLSSAEGKPLAVNSTSAKECAAHEKEGLQSFKYGMPRSFKYFKAIGNRDFVPSEEFLAKTALTAPTQPLPGRKTLKSDYVKTINQPICDKLLVRDTNNSIPTTSVDGRQVAPVKPRVVAQTCEERRGSVEFCKVIRPSDCVGSCAGRKKKKFRWCGCCRKKKKVVRQADVAVIVTPNCQPRSCQYIDINAEEPIRNTSSPKLIEKVPSLTLCKCQEIPNKTKNVKVICKCKEEMQKRYEAERQCQLAADLCKQTYASGGNTCEKCQGEIRKVKKNKKAKVVVKCECEEAMAIQAMQCPCLENTGDFVGLGKEAHVVQEKETCTCATQVYKFYRDACTSYKIKLEALKKKRDSTSNTGNDKKRKVEIKGTNRGSHGVQCQLRSEPVTTAVNTKGFQTNAFSSSESIISFNSFETPCSFSDEGTKTDTTVYSLAAMYDNEPNKRKYKVKVTTKANRSTETDTKKTCNVSTVTSDWWSPVLERKNKALCLINNQGDVKSPIQERATSPRKRFRNKGISTDGRTVKFRSRTQIIPSQQPYKYKYDLMSPSRYLLESQKYYNELFSNNFYSPGMVSVNTAQVNEKDHATQKKPLSMSNPRSHRKRKHYKTKRLEESYAAKKITTPRHQLQEEIYAAEAKQQKRLSSTGSKKYREPRSGTKPNAAKKSKNRRRHYSKPVLVVKRGHVDLLSRCYVSNEELSMDCLKNCVDTKPTS